MTHQNGNLDATKPNSYISTATIKTKDGGWKNWIQRDNRRWRGIALLIIWLTSFCNTEFTYLIADC